MRLEPVYLVQPKPKPPSIPTRRAFLLAGGTFAVGAAVGGACGFVIGSGGSGVVAEREPPADPTLLELRRLATDAPIERLMAKAQVFLSFLQTTYREDAALWHGATRIGQHLIANPDIVQRRILAQWLLQTIEKGDPRLTTQATALIPSLRRIR